MPYLTLQLSDEGVKATTEAASAADLGEHYEDAEVAVLVDGVWDGTLQMAFESDESAESFRETLVTGST